MQCCHVCSLQPVAKRSWELTLAEKVSKHLADGRAASQLVTMLDCMSLHLFSNTTPVKHALASSTTYRLTLGGTNCDILVCLLFQLVNILGKRYGVHPTTTTERYKGASSVACTSTDPASRKPWKTTNQVTTSPLPAPQLHKMLGGPRVADCHMYS